MDKTEFDLIKILFFKNNTFAVGRDASEIQSIILHSFGYDLSKIIKVLNEEGASYHYLIPQTTGAELLKVLPEIYQNLGIEEYHEPLILFPDQVPVIQLVDDSDKAYHAGKSSFGSLKAVNNSLNAVSLGIGFESPDYGKNGTNVYHFSNFSAGQKATGISLIQSLMEKHAIPQYNLLAHSTVAIGRKTYPGPNFFWKDLNEAGLGYLPDSFTKGDIIQEPSPKTIKSIQKKLQAIGFTSCPINSLLDDVTCDCIDAYLLQFAGELWEGYHQELSVGLLKSLESFDLESFLV